MALTEKEFINDFKEEYFDIYSDNYQKGTNEEIFFALGTLIRQYTAKPWKDSRDLVEAKESKQIFYFSIEFLPGRFLKNNLYNLGILDLVKSGLTKLDIDFNEIVETESEPAIGNGGLGRLASCFMDSGAALGLPMHGNGIRYKYGLFKQRFLDGHQVELPDNWLRNANPWEIRNLKGAVKVRFGGNVWMDDKGAGLTPVYENTTDVLAVPYEHPMIGYGGQTVNNMRLWSAEVSPKDEELYDKRKHDEIKEITEFLYPDDSTYEGKKLRLKQEYFFVSAGVQSIIRTFKKYNLPRKLIPEKIAIQINDTHPTLVIPELMRILLDEEKMSWDQAWEITRKTVAYTNHTVLREALETWPEDMFEELLPRMYLIIKEIDRRYSEQSIPIYGNKLTHSTRIIKDDQIYMAHLAILGSFSVNGVASLHTDILKEDVLNDFYEINPNKFNNKTNGITQRRFMHVSNPDLTQLITDKIGEGWKTDPAELKLFKSYQDDTEVLKQLAHVKKEDKKYLAEFVKETQGIELNTDAIFDVMIKRLHAYKRQHMQLLHIIDRYLRIKVDKEKDIQPRVFIFGAKAAPSYRFAKQVIKVINEVADLVNNDEEVNKYLQVVFIENYNVSKAEIIIPAAEISEQISLAGKEASGTGNMKMMLNGALTMATMDGANVEINSYIGDENMFIFGLSREEVDKLNQEGTYSPRDIYENNPRLKRVIDALVDGTIPNIKDEGQAIVDELVGDDEYYVLKDFDSFIEAQDRADKLYKNKKEWNKKSLINITSSGPFSSDYTVQRYADDIWQVKAVNNNKDFCVVSRDEPI